MYTLVVVLCHVPLVVATVLFLVLKRKFHGGTNVVLVFVVFHHEVLYLQHRMYTTHESVVLIPFDEMSWNFGFCSFSNCLNAFYDNRDFFLSGVKRYFLQLVSKLGVCQLSAYPAFARIEQGRRRPVRDSFGGNHLFNHWCLEQM